METKRNHDVLPFSDWRSTEDKDRQTDTHIHTIPTEGLCFCSCCLALLHYQPVPSLAGIIWVLKQSIISYLADKQKLLQGRIPELPCLQSVLGRPDRVPTVTPSAQCLLHLLQPLCALQPMTDALGKSLVTFQADDHLPTLILASQQYRTRVATSSLKDVFFFLFCICDLHSPKFLSIALVALSTSWLTSLPLPDP